MTADEGRRAGALAAADDRAAALSAAIEREFVALRRGVELLAWKLGLAGDRTAIAAVADEVLQEVVVRALSRPDAYDPGRSAHAWLLGIAVNVLRERRRQDWRERQRQPLPPTGTAESTELTPSEAVLATLHDLAAEEPYRLIELLELASPADRRVLTLAFVERLSGPALADALGVKEGAARVRLHRAVARLAVEYGRAETSTEDR